MCTLCQTCTHSCFPSHQCVSESVCAFTWHCTHVCVCVLFYSVCMIERIWVCLPADTHTHTHAKKLRVSVYKLTSWIGAARVRRERWDDVAAFHPANPPGMFGVPAGMKPPLREFSMEIHQHAAMVVPSESFCVPLSVQAQQTLALKLFGTKQ